MLGSIATGLIGNYLYDLSKKKFPERMAPYIPAFFNADPNHIREAEKLVNEAIDEVRQKHQRSKTVEIFLAREHIVSEGVLKSVFDYFFQGGPDPETILAKAILSCAVAGEFTSTYPTGVRATVIAKEIVRAIEIRFRASERLVGFLTHTCLENLSTRVGAVLDIAKKSIEKGEDHISAKESSISNFLHDYLSHLKRQVEYIRLHGVEKITSQGAFSQALGASYIEIELNSAGTNEDSYGPIVDRKRNRHKASSAIQDLQKVIIKGQAGSGKTTVLHWLISKSEVDKEFNILSRLVPFFPIYIPLRRLEGEYIDDWSFENVFFSTLRASLLQSRYPKNLVEFISKHDSSFAFFLDGVDEVSERNRGNFWRTVEDIEKKFPGSKIVITTRHLSNVHYSDGSMKDSVYRDRASLNRARSQWRPSEEFFEFNACSLSNTQISNFVDRWFDGVDKTTQSLGGADQDWVNYPQRLKRLLFSARQEEVRRLARTPLLCSLICLVFLLRDGTLPASRRQLYEIATKLLLEVRDESRDVRVSEPFSLFDLSRRESLLQSIALEMQEGDVGRDAQSIEVKRTTVESLVEAWLKNNHLGDVSTSDLTNLILERCAIIREPATGIIDFVHRSFMEYLAANEIVLRRSPHSIRSRITNEQWISTLRFCMDTPQGGVYFGGLLIKELVGYLEEKYSRVRDRGIQRSMGYRVSSLLDHRADYTQEAQAALIKLCKILLPPETISEAQDCKEIPIQFLRGFLEYGEVSKLGSSAVSASAMMLSEHQDPRCAEYLSSGFQECADVDVIQAINTSGRVSFSAHTALRARIENGSYKRKFFLSADELQNVDFRKLIAKDVGIRFPFAGRAFVGWDALRKVVDLTLINPSRTDWDRMLESVAKSKFRDCVTLYIEGGTDFDLRDISSLAPRIKYLFLEDCRHFSARGLGTLKNVEAIEFRRISYPLLVNLNEVKSRLSMIDFISCGDVELIEPDQPETNHYIDVRYSTD